MAKQSKSVTVRPIDKLKGILSAESVQEQFKNALGANSNSFVASVIDLYNTDKSLQTCDPNQVVMEALRAAVLKLPLNKSLGFAYVLSFKNKGVPTPTFIIGYKGLIQLALRTGEYRHINADIVYEGEIKGRDKLTGAIDFTGERTSDKVMGYFAHIELLNGFQKTLYSEVNEIAKHAKKHAPSIKYSKNITVKSLASLAGKDPTGIGWTGDFDSMALKTVLRELLSKWGYLSIEMQSAIAKDIETDIQSERDQAIEDTEATIISMDDPEGPNEESKESVTMQAPY